MLRLYFGNLENAMTTCSVYFNEVMDNHCITTEFSKRMIREISGFEVLGNNIIRHPIFGDCPSRELAGGIKALLVLMYSEDDIVVNLSAMGNNCLTYLTEIAKTRDITVCTSHWRDLCFDDPIYIINCDKILNDESQIFDIWVDSL